MTNSKSIVLVLFKASAAVNDLGILFVVTIIAFFLNDPFNVFQCHIYIHTYKVTIFVIRMLDFYSTFIHIHDRGA